MRTIETLLRVGKDHTVNIKIKLPKEFAPGDYNALVVMDEKSQEIAAGRWEHLWMSFMELGHMAEIQHIQKGRDIWHWRALKLASLLHLRLDEAVKTGS